MLSRASTIQLTSDIMYKYVYPWRRRGQGSVDKIAPVYLLYLKMLMYTWCVDAVCTGNSCLLVVQAHRLEIKIWNLKMEVSEHLNPTSTEPCSGSDCFSSAPHHWRDLIVFNVTPAEMESLYLFVLIKKGCLCSEGKAEHKIKWNQQHTVIHISLFSFPWACFNLWPHWWVCSSSLGLFSISRFSNCVPDSGISSTNHCQHTR